MKRPLLIIWLCVLLSAVFMSVPWLVPHCGFFALFGLVPLLVAEDIADRHGIRRFWLMVYLCFVLWNAATTWWVKNATVGGAVFAVLANAFQMAAVWWAYRMFKRRTAGILPYIFLAALWIAWEKWYLQAAEISWPWLVLGNAFAQSTRSIQWYEITGSLGGSLWVWMSNLSIFWLLRSLTGEEMKPLVRKAMPFWTALVIGFPYAASAHIWHYLKEDSEGSVPVVIAQPNFDPYEKFTAMSQAEQTEVLLGLYDEALKGDSSWTGLLLAPETFTGDIFLDDIPSSPTFRSFQAFLDRYPGAGLLFGASTYDVYRDRRSKPHILARRFGNGWVVNHNSAILTDTSGRADIFHKSEDIRTPGRQARGSDGQVRRAGAHRLRPPLQTGRGRKSGMRNGRRACMLRIRIRGVLHGIRQDGRPDARCHHQRCLVGGHPRLQAASQLFLPARHRNPSGHRALRQHRNLRHHRPARGNTLFYRMVGALYA